MAVKLPGGEQMTAYTIFKKITSLQMLIFISNPLFMMLFFSYSAIRFFFLQVLAIINELKDGQSWPEALKHVPCKRVEINSDFDNADNSNKIIRLTAHSIRENYRKNLVYDLLLQKK